MIWIDHELSGRLLTLCQAGESQKVDYKQEVPDNARDLAKDIAAFASSGGGLILLGVRDNGSIVGIPNADQPGVRDLLSQRIAGICKAIEPPVRPKLRWAVVNDQAVLAIDVPAGSEPMYYVEHKPYLRHETTCRPAKPSEVYEAVKAHTREASNLRGNSNFILTRLATVLVTLLRWAHIDSEARNLKPWVDEWERDAKNAADTLRDLAIEASVDGTELENELRTLAEALDEVANFTHTLGGGTDFDDATERVGHLAQKMLAKHVSPVPLSAEAQASARQAIVKYGRKLKDVWTRAEKAPFTNQVPEAQKESGEIGRRLIEFSFYGVAILDGRLCEQIRQVGLRLFDIETRTMYYDGGASQRRVITEGLECSALLANVFDAIEKTC